MRLNHWLLTITLLVTAGLASPVSAQVMQASDPPTCDYDPDLDRVICEGQKNPNTRPNGNPIAAPPTTEYPYEELLRPILVTSPDGGQCIQLNHERLGRDPTVTETGAASQLHRMLLADGYRTCPGTNIPSNQTPYLAALAFWESAKLLKPKPSIRFNEILVGLKAYLETGIEDTMTFGPVDTPFGPLTIDATADIYVDWGDPHDDDGEEGPYRDAFGETATPGPYPDGEVTHIYQYVGEYDITVRYQWTADWRIGGVSGVLPGGETSGTLEDFVAYERQAVGRP